MENSKYTKTKTQNKFPNIFTENNRRLTEKLPIANKCNMFLRNIAQTVANEIS